MMPTKIIVVVKPNKKENRIIEHDTINNTMTVEIAAQAQKNKANIELTKFLSKQLGKKVRIKTGFTSKEKICEIE